jgi:predicted MFS family arabinose efflux permease
MAVNAIVGLWGIHLVYQMRIANPTDGQLLTDRFSENVISAVLGGVGLIFCAGIIIWGSFVLGRLREITVMRISSVGLFMICAGAVVVNHFGGERELLLAGLAVVVVGLAIMSGFLPAAVTYLARLSGISAEDRGLLMGVYSVVLGLGQGIGIFLGGRFADAAGVDGIILLTFLLGLVGAVSVFRLVHMSDADVEATKAGKVGMSLHA